MRILGLGGLDHNGSAALVEGGRVRAFLELERVTRNKNQGIDGAAALDALLDRLDVGTIDHIAIADLTFFDIRAPWLVAHLAARFPRAPRSLHRHHDAHLACSFAASPFESASLVSIDGKGDDSSGALGRAARTTGVVVDREIPSAHSIGRLWWAASEYAGLAGHHSAGKTMALAAYGTPRFVDAIARHVSHEPDGTFRLAPRDLHSDVFRQVPRLVAWLEQLSGVARVGGEIEAAHRDMAASVQRVTEELVLALARGLVERTGDRRLCLSGGVALNGRANQALLDAHAVDALFVPPCTDDRGLSIGAAALASWAAGVPMRAEPDGLSPFLGPEPAALESHPTFERVLAGAAAVDEVAARLARGEVVAWFEGRDEAGPRALGHRSILASPTFPWMRDHLNRRIKKREMFRPFGCSILASATSEWFECEDASPYMLRIVRARAERRASIPAVLHVDGTSRLHTVTTSAAPSLAALLRRLVALGHPPLVLDTSLNGRGEPIVHTAEQALDFAASAGLPAAYVSGALYRRREGIS